MPLTTLKSCEICTQIRGWVGAGYSSNCKESGGGEAVSIIDH